MNVNLKLLQTFLLVAEHRSFVAAAEESHRSGPAVSMQIKQLEAQLGVTLFRRTTRNVELTPEGTQLLAAARRALNELDNGLTQLREAVDFHSARVALSCIPTVAGTLLPPILAAFSKEYPRVTVHVREVGVPELQSDVRSGDVDFGIGLRTARGMTGLAFRSVLDDEYYALVEQGYRPQRTRGITLRELAMLPVLSLAASTRFQEDIQSAAREQGVRLQTRYEFMQISTMVAMAEQGLGVAVLPRVAIPAHTHLKPLPVIEPALRREIGIVSARGKPLTPVAQRFAELIETHLSSHKST